MPWNTTAADFDDATRLSPTPWEAQRRRALALDVIRVSAAQRQQNPAIHNNTACRRHANLHKNAPETKDKASQFLYC